MKIKKIMAVVSAVALTLAVGMTSFAAPSITGGIKGGGRVKTESGNDFRYSVGDPMSSPSITDIEKEKAISLMAADYAARLAAQKEAFQQAGVVITDKHKPNVLGVVDIDISGLEEGDSAVITVNVPSAKRGDVIIVLHYNEKLGKWEKIDAEVVEDGVVSIRIENASPFAFFVLTATDSEGGGTVVDNPTKGSGTDGQTTTAAKTAKASSTTSPKTGESTMVLMLGMVALVAAGSAFGLKKRA